MVHFYLLLAHWLSLWYTILSYWPTNYPCGTQSSLLAHWLSLWYKPIFYSPSGYLYGSLPSPIGPLTIYMEHYYLLLAQWLSVGTLLSASGPLVISMIMSLANSQFCYRYSLECKMIPHSIVKLRLSNDEDLV